MRGAWRKWRFGKFPDEPEELSLSELSRKVPATQCAAPSARRSGDNGRGLWIVMSSDNTDHTENTASQRSAARFRLYAQMMHPPAPSGAPAVEHGKVWERRGSAKAGVAAGRRQSWHTAAEPDVTVGAADGAAAALAPVPLAKVI